MPSTLFFASLNTETNTFSNIPTTEASFEEAGFARGAGVLEGPHSVGEGMRALFTELRAKGFEIIPSISTLAAPAAPVQQAVYEKYAGMILEDLRAAMPVDLVLLALHGAMVAQGCNDCEGDLLGRIREVLGPAVPVGVVLDPHAHLTDAMVRHASVLSFMKEYPHTDGLECTRDVVDILLAIRDGRVQPTPAVFDCRVIGMYPTPQQPMRGFVDGLIAREGKDGVLSVSFIHGFPWGDTPDTGAKVLVYADNDPQKAAQVAAEIHTEFWAIKDAAQATMVSVETAIQAIRAAERGPIVLADVADNPGGGAPSDATFLLRAVLDAGLTNVGFGLFYDPEAVRTSFAAGLGAKLRLRIGGKIGPESGLPVDLEVEVMGLQKAARMDVQGLVTFAMGDTAWVRGHGVDIVLNTVRVQLYDPTGLSHIGLDPKSLKAIVVKSGTHFRIGFDAIAADTLLVNTPGALDFDFACLPYRALTKPFYPKVADPFAELP